jgi:hypothetical protein
MAALTLGLLSLNRRVTHREVIRNKQEPIRLADFRSRVTSVLPAFGPERKASVARALFLAHYSLACSHLALGMGTSSGSAFFLGAAIPLR